MLGSQTLIAFDFDGEISFLNPGVEFAVTRFLKVFQVLACAARLWEVISISVCKGVGDGWFSFRRLHFEMRCCYE